METGSSTSWRGTTCCDSGSPCETPRRSIWLRSSDRPGTTSARRCAASGPPVSGPAGWRRAGPSGSSATRSQPRAPEPDSRALELGERDWRRARLDGREPRRPGLLPYRRSEPCPPLGAPLPDGALPWPGRYGPGVAVGRPDPRHGPDWRSRRLDEAPPLRPDLEPRPPAPERPTYRAVTQTAVFTAQPHPPPPRVQARHRLAAGDRRAVCRGTAGRGAGPRWRPGRGLRPGDDHELLRALD